MDENPSQYTLQSVDNALRLLEVMADSNSELGVAELSRRVHLGRTTVFRLLVTLEARGFVVQNPSTSKYRLGVKLVYLGQAVLRHTSLLHAARHHLEMLVEAVGECAHLAVFDGREVTFMDKVETSRPYSMGSKIGARMPAYCTGTGKVLLAWLDEPDLARYLDSVELKRYTQNTIVDPEALRSELAAIRKRGYAVDNCEIEDGLMCLAVPVRGAEGTVVAAISVSGPEARMRAKQADALPEVLAAARRISRALGWNDEAAASSTGQ